MPSERVSDGILFDEDVSAAALSACCHLAVSLPTDTAPKVDTHALPVSADILPVAKS